MRARISPRGPPVSEFNDAVHLFEHPEFTDVYDALRQSRLHGFRYRAEHPKYLAFYEALRQRASAGLVVNGFARPVDKVLHNSAVYTLCFTPIGREKLLPLVLEEALASGFCAFDDRMGVFHTPAGVWSIDGFKPRLVASPNS